jgi:predicted acyl esterase
MDHGLHSRGTLESFKRIRSQLKWLEVHGVKKWAYYYRLESRIRQFAFFDRFLKGRLSESAEWRRVRVAVRKHGIETIWRSSESWPLSEMRARRLYIDLKNGRLQEVLPSRVTSRWYLATSGGVDRLRCPLWRLVCDYRFTEAVDAIGPKRLRLWVAVLDVDDTDLFVGLFKLDRDGGLITLPHYARYDDGPLRLD